MKLTTKLVFFVLLLYSSSSSLNAASIEEDLLRLSKINSTDLKASAELLKSLESRQDTFQNDSQRAQFFVQKAYALLLRSENSEAKKNLIELLSLKSAGKKHQLLAYHLLSQIEMNIGNYQKAFENLLNAIQMLPEVEQSFSVYHSAANIFHRIESYDEAFYYANRANQIAINSNNLVNKCFAIAKLGEINISYNELSKGLAALKEALPICQDNNLTLATTNVLKNIGIYYFKNNQLEIAEQYFNQALKNSEQLSYELDIMNIHSYLSKLYFKQSKFDKAVQLANQIINGDSKEGVSSIYRSEAYKTLSEVMKQRGDLQKAIDYIAQYNQLNENNLKDLATKNLAYQKVKYANADQDSQIKILDQKNQLLELNNQVEEQSKRNFQLLSFLVIFALTMAAIWLWRLKLQKEKYQTLSQTDGLTGIFNRSQSLALAEKSYAHSIEYDLDYSVIIFDLDYFKTINDQFGHAFGDKVLKEVAQASGKYIRKDDIFGRIGGEEFVIFLPNTSAENAYSLAERCKEAIASITSKELDNFVISASLGVVSKVNNKQSITTLINLADNAMYQAKKSGRNRVHKHNYNNHLE